jgi:hypothetical protein
VPAQEELVKRLPRRAPRLGTLGRNEHKMGRDALVQKLRRLHQSAPITVAGVGELAIKAGNDAKALTT